MGAPPDTIEEKVLKDIVSTLQSIDGVTPYNTKIRRVVDFEEWDDDLLVYPAAMVLALTTEENDSDFSDRQSVSLNFEVVLVLSEWVNSTARAAVSRAIADVKIALLANHQRSGYARDTEITRTERFQYDSEKGARAGASIFGTVKFRHIRADPYTQG